MWRVPAGGRGPSGSTAWGGEHGLRAAAPPPDKQWGAANTSPEGARALETGRRTGNSVLVFGDGSFAPAALFQQGQLFNVIFSAKMVIDAPVSLVPPELMHGEALCLACGPHGREIHFSSQLPPSQLLTTMFHLQVYLSWAMWL